MYPVHFFKISNFAISAKNTAAYFKVWKWLSYPLRLCEIVGLHFDLSVKAFRKDSVLCMGLQESIQLSDCDRRWLVIKVHILINDVWKAWYYVSKNFCVPSSQGHFGDAKFLRNLNRLPSIRLNVAFKKKPFTRLSAETLNSLLFKKKKEMFQEMYKTQKLRMVTCIIFFFFG